ncbi:MAG: hypothetical protein EZS28_003261 [Streblomastix strix]|uniref:Reverse transcriptase domain-containing protein n=1 Tax=Streblomastix strix TaxID=222440 RepID=A0A5J4X1K5_9EUKA|nr:MAG: hypothetical protein EZS28_003261 [Streblomastix strix]
MTQFDVPTQINHLNKSDVSQAYVPPTDVKTLHQTSMNNNNWSGTTILDVSTSVNHQSKCGVRIASVPKHQTMNYQMTFKDKSNNNNNISLSISPNNPLSKTLYNSTLITNVNNPINNLTQSQSNQVNYTSQTRSQASQSQENTLGISNNLLNISYPMFKQFQVQVTQIPHHFPIKIFPLLPNKDQQVAKLEIQSKDSSNSQQIKGISTPITNTDPSKCNYPIGGRLIYFQEERKKHGAQDLISRGISAKWISPSSIEFLMKMRRVPDQRRALQCGKQLETLIEKELQNKIIEEVKESQIKWFNPIFAIPKRGKGKWRKITDCSKLNDKLQEGHFKMEDIHVLRELMKQKDWLIKIDIESAYHHVPVNPNLRDFLGFKFKERSFRYVAMPFGIKHAPLIFKRQ